MRYRIVETPHPFAVGDLVEHSWPHGVDEGERAWVRGQVLSTFWRGGEPWVNVRVLKGPRRSYAKQGHRVDWSSKNVRLVPVVDRLGDLIDG